MEPRRRHYLLLGIIYLGYISLGLPDGTLGVAWPEIYPELHLPIGLAGTIITFGTVLTGIAGFSSGWVVARWRTGPVVLVSGVLTASGMLIIGGAQGALWLYAAAIPLGLGAGAVDASLNGFVARHYSGRHMNWLHACWGIGATSGPLLFGWALGAGHGWRGGYWLLGGLQMGLSGLFLVSLGLWRKVPEVRVATEADIEASRHSRHGANSFAGWLSVAIFALYVAVEMTTGLWASSVLVVHRGLAPETAALCVASYYGALTGGRILVGFVAEQWGNRRLVTGGTLVALAGLLGFAFANSVPLVALTLVLGGLGLAPIYPGLMHEVSRRFRADAVQTVIGRQSGGASFGAAVLPALAGGLAQHSLAAVPWLVLAVLVVMLGCIRRLDRIT